MRIVIDLQGAQTTGSRSRGIGRYSTALAQAIIRNRKDHEVHVVLNGAFPAAVDEIRQTFGSSIPNDSIHVFEPLRDVAYNVVGSEARRRTSEDLREFFIRGLRPDVVHVTSLFEGLIDEAVCSVGKLYTDIPTSVTLYDLIPLIHKDKYLSDRSTAGWYFERLDNLRRASSCFAISESARQEAIDYLGFDTEVAVNVSTAADPQFRKASLSARKKAKVCEAYGLAKPFVMYTGGIDLRKNVERLIRAYALLPKPLRDAHQLAIVCSVAPAERERLFKLANSVGLRSGELVMTGFVTETHLIALYNVAKLFVFPSWHEGFGLPALEAMHCGTPVIGSDRSSVPEVVGLQEALFDPFDERDIAARIRRGLDDEAFRARLVKNGIKQARRFSWDESGRRAVAGLERMHASALAGGAPMPWCRPRLAYVSPMPPARTGIAAYSAELLPQLTRHYEIDVVVKDDGVDQVELPICPHPIRVISQSEFRATWRRYDRILYHFGNSEFHDYMFSLLGLTSGVVILHDFFLSGAVAYREWHHQEPAAWAKELYRAHGYPAAREREEAEDPYHVVWKYPCSYSVLENAQRAIVHSKYAKSQVQAWYGGALSDKVTVVPQLREPFRGELDREGARKRLGLGSNDILICSFGMLGESKCNLELIDAWARSGLAGDSRCRLVFVGQNEAGIYGRKIVQDIASLPRKDDVAITGWVDRETFEDYLTAADIAVQLRTRSRGETSRAVLDCMSRGIPLIVNANGPMAELASEAAIILPDDFDSAALASALERLRGDKDMRMQLAEAGRRMVERTHAPSACADAYWPVIEAAGLDDAVLGRLTQNAARASLADAEVGIVSRETARMLAETPPRLLIDITALVQTDARTGIQRVVRNLLSHLLTKGTKSFRVEPVYVDPEARAFRFARAFAQGFADIDIGGLSDDVVDITKRDTLLLLDLNPVVLGFVSDELARLRRQGTRTVFVVYDLLPVQFPDMFPDDAEALHIRWLHWVSQADAAVCISQAVAAELREYVSKNWPESRLAVSTFPLGSGLEAVAEATELTIDLSGTINLDWNIPTFLMVGTIEPRKGYCNALDAFERLWTEGVNANLCIVGRPGWKVEGLVDRIEGLRGMQLVWIDDASDGMLEVLYRKASCLLAASYGEGFGLPLVEAALRGLPIIARDIPVFREVCGKGATYFSDDLAETVRAWLQNYRLGIKDGSGSVALTSWEQSAESLLLEVCGDLNEAGDRAEEFAD